MTEVNQKQSGVFYGWYIVGACALIILYAGGVTNLGFTAVFEPIADEFGWSYAQISLASSLRGANMGILALFVGYLADRWGPRKLVFAGGIILAIGLALLSQVSSLATFYGAYALMSIGFSTCSGTVLLTAVANWFNRKVGLATGIVASGFGLAGVLIPIITILIDALYWRTAMLIAGLGMLVIVLPLSLVLRHKPERYGYQLDGAVDKVPERLENHVPATNVESDITAIQALKIRTFWHIAIASLCHHLVINAVITHMMPFLSTLGIARSVASQVTLVIPIASIGGRLGSGWLGDRIGKKLVFAFGFTLLTAGLFIIGSINTAHLWQLILFVIAFSLGWGFSITSRITMMREYFGRHSFGTILGVMQGVGMIGNIAGAPIAGWVFDNWGRYQGVWLAYGTLTLLGTLLILTTPSIVTNIKSRQSTASQ